MMKDFDAWYKKTGNSTVYWFLTGRKPSFCLGAAMAIANASGEHIARNINANNAFYASLVKMKRTV
jgi:hypothetical protein